MRDVSYLKKRFPVGTKYVIESDGAFVRRYVEFPNGRRLRLPVRKALTCTCAERQTSIVPKVGADTLDDDRTFRRRIFA